MVRVEQEVVNLAAASEFPKRPLDLHTCRGGVLVRLPNWLGDAVMTLPALKQLRMLLETAGVPLYALVTPQAEGLCRALGRDFFAKVIVLEAAHESWNARECAAVQALRADVGVLLTNSLRDAIAFRRVGIRRLFGAKARMRGVLFERSFGFKRRIRHKLNAPHHACKYLSMIYALGAPSWDGHFPALSPAIPLEQINPVIAALQEHPNVLLMAAGAAYGAGKRWPSEHYRSLAEWQAARGGLALVLGSAKEAAIGAEIVDGLPENKVFNLCGQTNFSELLYLFGFARAMVANDSGLMHLAAAVGLPGVAVFGPTDYMATGPVGDNWTVLSCPERCSPCFYRECKTGKRCIAKVLPEAVEATLISRGL